MLRWIESLNEKLGRGVFWCLLAMVLIGTLNTGARKIDQYLQQGSERSELAEPGITLSSNAYLETQWYLFSLVFLLGAPYALRHNAHVRVDVLYDRLRPRTRAWINLIGHALLLLPFALVMVERSLDSVWESIRSGEMSNDPGGLPRYIIKPFVPLAFTLLSFQAIVEITKQLRILRDPPEDSPTDSSTDPSSSSPSSSTPSDSSDEELPHAL